MTQTQRLLYMIDYLIHERADQEEIAVLADEAARKQLLHALMNIRMPKPVSKEFLTMPFIPPQGCSCGWNVSAL